MKVLFLGGDIRQQYASEYLCQNGIESNAYIDFSINEEIIKEINKVEAIVLPLPISKDGIYLNSNSSIILKDLFDNISKSQIVLGGKVPIEIYSYPTLQKNKIIDYNNDEFFAVQNALLSSEGAIFYAKQKINKSIHGSNIAIFGFGRIGKILSYLLNVQGAHITVYTRKELDCAWSKLIGFNTCRINNYIIKRADNFEIMNFDLIFNTIPFHIIDENLLGTISKDSIIVDLASFPYGIDETLIDKYQLKYYKEPGIPGRYAPKSAGEIIGATIMNILAREQQL